MTETNQNPTERVRNWTTACIALILLWTAVGVWRHVSQRPSPGDENQAVLYFPDPSRGDLFEVTPSANGMRITPAGLRCRAPGADPAADGRSAFEVRTGESFLCGANQLQIVDTGESAAVMQVGFSDLTLPVIVGSGHRFVRDDGIPRRVFAGPGVGVDHLLLLPIDECDNPPANAVACVQNGGASGSLLVDIPSQAQAALRHDERIAVTANTRFWLGYVPFLLTSAADGLLRLDVQTQIRSDSWLDFGGDRRWMDLELPTWPLSRRASQPVASWLFRSERAEYTVGNLTPTRYEREQEEQLQTLIDHEILCVDGVTTRLARPRLVLRDANAPGCSELDQAGTLRAAAPLSFETSGVVRDALRDTRLRQFIAQEAERLAQPQSSTADASSLLLLDYRRVMPGTANDPDATRVAVALLGVRPRSTLHRVEPPEPPAELPALRFAANSSSPILVLQLPTSELALALVKQTAPMVVCAGTPLRGGLDFPLTGALPLGAASIRQDAVSWAPTVPTPLAGPCASFTRNVAGVTMRALAQAAVSVERFGMARTVGGGAENLADGDRVRIGNLSLLYRASEERAAYSANGDRYYPLEADAIQLVGLAALSGGLEGGMDERRRRQLAQPAAARLTIDADLQRVLSRELDAALRRHVGSEYRNMRAAAVLMNAEDGSLVAVANAPRFDPWWNEADRDLLSKIKRGEPGLARQAEVRLQNYAFLRAAEIGSTQKVATSIAMAREGWLPAGGPEVPRDSCANSMAIDYHGVARSRLKCDKTTTHAVLAGGNINHHAWPAAFADSCNVYFSIAAAQLVPAIAADPNACSRPTAGPKLRFAERLDPARDLRPVEITNSVTGQGNGFFETMMLLGYRFEFRGSGGLNSQTTVAYNALPYPSVARPWLSGLENGWRGFVYPTMPAPETFSNRYRGDSHQPVANQVLIERPPRHAVQGTLPLRSYLQLAFGQSMTASPLSMAAMTTPILQSNGALATPQIFQNAVRRAAVNESILSVAARTTLRDGLARVITSGTGRTYFGGVIVPAGIALGGKTGTITIARPRPVNATRVYDRALQYGCGVIGAQIDAAEWNGLSTEAGAAGASLPPWGFGAADAVCAEWTNPGQPRINATLNLLQARVWTWLAAMTDVSEELRTMTSSAFIAALWPTATNAPLRQPLVLAVVADHHPSAAKHASADIVASLLRWITTRE